MTDATMQEAVVTVHGQGGLPQEIQIGRHRLRADEPTKLGGEDSGPTPYQLLLAALGACISMTVSLYARRKGWPLEGVEVRLSHDKIHAADCAECETREGKIDRILRDVRLEGPLDDEQRARLLDIARRCPVGRTLMSEIHFAEAGLA
jgi:putative redox protein